MNIWLPKTASQPERYTLGHPVFMSQGVYLFTLQAQEEYCYNNRTDTVPDIVKLHEGMVYFHNDLVGDLVTDSAKLDTNGYGTYMFSPKNTTFLGNDESSLRTLDINLKGRYTPHRHPARPARSQQLCLYRERIEV